MFSGCSLLQLPRRRNPLGRFSPSSSSDAAPSLDDSIESGPLSDLQSEYEGRRSADRRLQVNGRRCATLVQRLLEDVRGQDKDMWTKIEVRSLC